MKRLNQISIFFFLLLAIGCNSQTESPTSLPIAATIENTETPKPTSTPTASPSPTPEQVTIEFPEWVKNPETQILLFPFTQQSNVYKNLALINAETGERFDIPFTQEAGTYFWSPNGQKIGFLRNNSNHLTVYSLNDGKINFIDLPEKAFRFFKGGVPKEITIPAQATSSDFTHADFKLIPFSYSISSNYKYLILGEKCDEFYFCIYDIQENEIVKIFEMNSEITYLSYEISPNSEYLAVVEVDKNLGYYFTFDEEPNFLLKVYDIATQQLSAVHKNITSADWSPDGSGFLYSMVTHQENYSILGTPPCIFEVLSRETRCFKIENVAYPNWSPDQKTVSFISADIGKGFCMIELISENINCILEKLDDENQMPINYIWSPDSKFIAFSYDASCPYCDYHDRPKFAIADVTTGKYFSIDYTNYYFEPGLWRPSPNP
jgi:hypothetical protein